MKKLPIIIIYTILSGMVLYIVSAFVCGTLIIDKMSDTVKGVVASTYVFCLMVFCAYYYKMGPFEDQIK
jgi:hypothetical protein